MLNLHFIMLFVGFDKSLTLLCTPKVKPKPLELLRLTVVVIHDSERLLITGLVYILAHV